MKIPTDNHADSEAIDDQEIASVVHTIVDAFSETVRLAAPQASDDDIEAFLHHFVMGLFRRLNELES